MVAEAAHNDSVRRGYFHKSPEEKALGLHRVIDDNGIADPEVLEALGRERCVDFYRGMATIRIMDARLMTLQRQGRIGFYAEALGQEAAVIGCAAALSPEDWLVPALREAGAGIYRGLSMSAYIAQLFGTDRDVSRGRQMPCHPCDPQTHYVVMSSCVSSQIPHAVGIAWGMKIRGDRSVCMGFMGDGGTSEPDFHYALNFAGVGKVPAVLVCQNNQWAISTPGDRQTAAPTIAIKGLGYGVESLRADGNDVLAVYEVARYAVEKARREGTPTFLELLTYRVSAHSSSDDPSRYRDETITETWKRERDPLAQMAAVLEARGWLGDADRKAMEAAIEADVRRVIAEEEGAPPPPTQTLFEDVFESPTWLLREQRDSLPATKVKNNGK